jgi:hypothetical protein
MGEIYRKQPDGTWAWEKRDDTPKTPVAPAVKGDTFKTPLRHPVTGKVYDSESQYMRATKREGCEVVGNDLLSKKKQVLQEKITDAVIMDRIERAEAIASDPTKFRARQNENMERLERRKELLGIKD